jgi:hypothetical protein
MEVYYRGERTTFAELKEPIRKISQPVPPASRAMMVRRPKQDHPWRQGWQNMKPRFPRAPLDGMRTYASP